MLLTIGMIVKNEEKYLERCLTALQPILTQLDSELIIADTGSTDRTVEIARKFTDNVFHFEWINDFAAARNATLEKAKGEWYMFIDADEIAADCTEFIKFFKSGQYKKYYSANYIVRSYLDVSNKDNISDARLPRMVKLDPETKFVGRIHEYFSYIKVPTMFLDFVVDHYGYAFTDNGDLLDLAYEKHERNLEGILKELAEEGIEKRNPNIYREAADCYNLIRDHKTALEYLDRGLRELPHDDIIISQYYLNKISVLSRLQDIEGIIETANEFLDEKKNPWHNKTLASDCYVHYFRGYAYYKQQNYRGAISELVQTFDLYKRYKQNKLNTEELIYCEFSVNEHSLKAAYDVFFRCCYQEKQFELANEYIRAIHIEKYDDNLGFLANHLNIRVAMMENVGYNDLDFLYNQLNEFGKTHLLNNVRMKVFTTSEENRKMIIKKLSMLGEMTADIAKIYQGYFDDNAPDFELIKAFLEKYGSENAEDMLYIMLENQMDISPFLLTEDFFADRSAQLLSCYFPHGFELYENYNIDNLRDGLDRAASLYGYVMLRAMEKGHNVSELFEKYGALGMKWHSTFGESESTPGDIRAAQLVYDVVSAKESGDRAKFKDAVGKIKARVSDLIPLVDIYEKENKYSFNTTRANPEFERLAFQVKNNIRDLIAAGSIGDARKLIKEYEGISPDDPDIETLKNELNNSLQ